MRKSLCLLLVIVVFALSGCQLAGLNSPKQNSLEMSTASLDINVMTFNIRNGRAEDGENHWRKRKHLVFGVIADQAADVIGIQEAFRFQLDELNKVLPEYSVIGEGRGGSLKDEYSAILYRKDHFIVDESDTFWLSDTPAIPSKHWGNDHLRICTWARLIDKHSGLAFYIYNTHLDNHSQLSREKSVHFIARVIQARSYQDPFILMGDFNAGEDNRVIAYLLANETGAEDSAISMVDSYRVIHPDTEQVGTFNDFVGSTDGDKIDYIFVELSVTIIDAAILKDNENGRYPSDHFPLTTHIKLQ